MCLSFITVGAQNYDLFVSGTKPGFRSVLIDQDPAKNLNSDPDPNPEDPESEPNLIF